MATVNLTSINFVFIYFLKKARHKYTVNEE